MQDIFTKVDAAVWVAIVAAAAAILTTIITTVVVYLGNRSTRKTAEEANSLKVLEAALSSLRLEVERLTHRVDSLTREASERESVYHRALAYIRQLRKQVQECGLAPITPPEDVASDI